MDDPFGFLDKYEESIVIDEVQRNPKIFMAISEHKKIIATSSRKCYNSILGETHPPTYIKKCTTIIVNI